MLRVLMLAVGLVVLLPCASPGKAPAQNQDAADRWAILVGVDDYAEIDDLRYCGADMHALRDQLAQSGFPQEQVFLLEDKAEAKYRPSKANILRQLDLVLKIVEPNSLVVVGFSGHGVQIGEKSYLCPTEAQLDDTDSLIRLDDIYRRLDESPATLKLLLVDACRDDPRLPGQKSAKGYAGTKGFAKERLPAGMLLLTSCAAGQISMEDEDMGHGVFMNFMLAGLRGDADGDDDGCVSLSELYKFTNKKTKTHVAIKYNGFQTPSLEGKLADDFEITRALSPLQPGEIITNSIGMKLVEIPIGEFLMGTTGEEVEELLTEIPDAKREYFHDEQPQHRVRITKPFYLGQHEVTLGQFLKFYHDAKYEARWKEQGDNGVGYNSEGGESKFEFGEQYVPWSWNHPSQTQQHPVVNVSWNDAVAFCEWLSLKEGHRYRLPTEAEWEYACRAGTQTRYCHSNDAEESVKFDNVADASTKEQFPDWSAISARDGYAFSAPVGQFRSNSLGLCDMHGNVWEWCSDGFDGDYYEKLSDSVAEDPEGAPDSEYRSMRGGAWDLDPRLGRSTYRNGYGPKYRGASIGFRVVRVP
jgi:sulfatase modifying factor 1